MYNSGALHRGRTRTGHTQCLLVGSFIIALDLFTDFVVNKKNMNHLTYALNTMDEGAVDGSTTFAITCK